MKKNKDFHYWRNKIMKWSFLHLCIAVIFANVSFAADALAQEILNRKISIQATNQNISTVLSEIEKNADVKFSYSPNLIRASRKVSISIADEKLSSVLDKLLTPQKIKYEIVGRQIILKRDLSESIKSTDLSPNVLSPAERLILGKVTDEKGEGLPGVNILEKGTTKGAISNGDGKFSISVSDEKSILIFSFVGHVTKEVVVGNRDNLAVVLDNDNKALDEVVVVGYGTQKKKDLTGAISSVAVKEIDKTPITRADQMIQGKVSGVQVIQTNAAPGGNVSIRIRGTNSINSGNEPLFVVDGFPGVGDLNTINPSDIESIEILKDASSTAIYGSRGANGVVLITTKKGKSGKQSINFEAYTGVQQVSKKYEMMNAREFSTYLDSVTVQNNRNNGTKNPLNYSTAQIAGMGVGTNWQDQILRPGKISNYQLSISGGNSDSQYNFSVGYFNQEGIVINSGFERGTLRFNFDKIISPRIKMGYTSQLAYSSQNDALVNTVGGSVGGTVYDALRFNPVLPVRDSTGTYTYRNDDPNHVVDVAGNPVAYAQNVTDRRSNLRGLLTAFGEYEILDGLKLRMSIGTDVNYSTRDYYTPSYLYIATQNTSSGSAQKSSNINISWVNENTLSYDKQINNNNFLSVVAGASVQVFKVNTFNAAANNFFTNQLGTDNLGIAGTTLPNSTNAVKNTLASFFGRINYQLMSKYLFTVTMRADGSSRFGDGNKWGYFPSGAFAWRMINEDFIEKLKVFSDLKLRAGFGVTGNQEIGSYQSLPQYTANGYTLAGTRVVGISPNNIPNPNLSWESTASSDIGLDMAFFKNRLSVTSDIYYKKTQNLLFNKYIPTESGFSNALINAGSLENKGLEISLKAIPIMNKDFDWEFSGNISFNRNKVLDLNGTDNLLAGSSSGSIFPGTVTPTSILRVGEPIGSFYGYQFNGIWQTNEEINASGIKTKPRPGDPKYIDANNDGLITGVDRTIIGNALPKFVYGLTNNVRYKKWNLSVFMQGVSGYNILNENLYELESGFTGTNKLKYVATESWNGAGTSNKLPSVSSILRRGTGITSDVIEKGDYLRVKTATLSYTLNLGKAMIVKTATIYVTGQNLFTFTNYSGYNPEVNSYGNNSNANNMSLNTDYNSYPLARTFIVGAKIGF